MKKLDIGPLQYEFSRFHEPRVRIQSGETLVVASEDALTGQIRTNDDRRDKVKAHAGLQGGDRNICNMLLSSDLPLALVLCTNSKKPI